ncbi:unnamed protein product [Paramecium primaurelia]|uniref:Uncharacterized protein n=1 Tax=Paramecium primaurelia TaxID=5886 RepID=A0A8S1Q6F9_PARPR|nr:unnamed protein product [Paramecium primaurelia]
MNCTYHIQSPISMICIAPHKCQCQRKLCVKCCYDHGVDQKYIVSAVKFQDMTQKILKDSKLNDTSELTKQRKHFKSLFSQIEQILKKMLEELSLSIKQVFDWIEKENQSFFYLLQENCNIAESSSTDLEKLVQIVEGSLLNDWSVQRNSYFTRLQNISSWWGQEFQNFSEKIIEKSKKLLHNNYVYRNQPLKPNQQLDEYTNKFIGILWDYSYNQPLQLKLNLQITFTQNKEIQYIKDGYKIRIDKIKETTRKPEILTNLEQIQHFYWSGNYGQKNQKIGNWLATWKGETIQGVGGKYSDDGQKQGKWREIVKNYWSLGKVFEEGEYVKDQRIAVWKYIYENNEIGGGGYNTEGLKIGKWIDLSEGFWQYSQLTQNGQYRNGKKVGRWDIFYREQSSDSFKQMQKFYNIIDKIDYQWWWII